MSTTINHRGRIQGTRITVYDILTYSEAGWHPSSIAAVLGISTEQVKAALQYISEHESDVLANYQSVLERIEQGNSPEIEAKRAGSRQLLQDKLKKLEPRNGA